MRFIEVTRMRFIEVTSRFGEKIFINAKNIDAFVEDSEGKVSVFVCGSNDSFNISETLEEFMQILGE